MRKHRILAIALTIFIGASQLVLGQTVRFAMDGPRPATLDALINFSSVIVEATVESAYPIVDQQSPGLVYSDFSIRVNRVVKGSVASNQIAVHQAGGTVPGGKTAEPGGYSLMMPGERYILFLDANPPPGLPNRGLPRYMIAAGFHGLAKVEGGQIVWSKGMPEAWKKSYGLRADELIAVIDKSQGR